MSNNELYYHKHYNARWRREGDPWCCEFSGTPIETIRFDFETDPYSAIIRYRSGEQYSWGCKYITSYIRQFGISVSPDGEKVFLQTWETGLFCFSARTGERLWRTKSRRGVTDIFVGDDTLTVQLHDYGMMLLSMETGEVLKEKRPYGVWGFTAIDHRYLIAGHRKWDLIEAETLEVMEQFSRKDFTGNHPNYTVNHISYAKDGRICVKGFHNINDYSTRPIKAVETLHFEHFVESEVLQLGGNKKL